MERVSRTNSLLMNPFMATVGVRTGCRIALFSRTKRIAANYRMLYIAYAGTCGGSVGNESPFKGKAHDFGIVPEAGFF